MCASADLSFPNRFLTKVMHQKTEVKDRGERQRDGSYVLTTPQGIEMHGVISYAVMIPDDATVSDPNKYLTPKEKRELGIS